MDIKRIYVATSIGDGEVLETHVFTTKETAQFWLKDIWTRLEGDITKDSYTLDENFDWDNEVDGEYQAFGKENSNTFVELRVFNVTDGTTDDDKEISALIK